MATRAARVVERRPRHAGFRVASASARSCSALLRPDVGLPGVDELGRAASRWTTGCCQRADRARSSPTAASQSPPADRACPLRPRHRTTTTGSPDLWERREGLEPWIGSPPAPQATSGRRPSDNIDEFRNGTTPMGRSPLLRRRVDGRIAAMAPFIEGIQPTAAAGRVASVIGDDGRQFIPPRWSEWPRSSAAGCSSTRSRPQCPSPSRSTRTSRSRPSATSGRASRRT